MGRCKMRECRCQQQKALTKLKKYVILLHIQGSKNQADMYISLGFHWSAPEPAHELGQHRSFTWFFHYYQTVTSRVVLGSKRDPWLLFSPATFPFILTSSHFLFQSLSNVTHFLPQTPITKGWLNFNKQKVQSQVLNHIFTKNWTNLSIIF